MVDFLKAAKNVISGKSPMAESSVASDNRIDRIDQCKIIWYQWANELGTDPNTVFGFTSPIPLSSPASELAKARSYDISNHIESYSYTKGMGAAAGTFQLTLQNSFDWARYLRPGHWLCVFLAGDGSLPLPAEGGGSATKGLPGLSNITESVGSLVGLQQTPELPLPKGPTSETMQSMKSKLRCLGIIQRVGIRSQTTTDGAVELVYTITGKDYGTIYDETELWFNANHADGAAFSAAVHEISTTFTKNLTELLKQYHSIFLNPGDTLSKALTSANVFFPEQWVMPDRLVQDLALPMKPTGKGFFGDIANVTEFNATIFENPMPNPLAGLQGRAWEKLKQISQPEFHELFTELSDSGNPKIIFRPIPWSMDKSRYPVVGKVMLSYKDLASPGPVNSPLPVGTIAASFKSLASLDSALKSVGGADADSRTQHSIPLTATEVESFDVGPDYHSRANFFLVDAMTAMKDQNNAFALMAKIPVPPFPFRDENDIKRHGFRPLFVNVNTFLVSNSQLFGNSAQKAFMLELNEILRDFYANAEDYYSGTISIAAGKNSVKLGKVFVTDGTFRGIDNMVFYIEGYSDMFAVNSEGTCTWTQTASVTRGMQYETLTGNSPKDKRSTQSGTFHVNQNGSGGSDSMLGKVKGAISNPASLF